MSETVEAEKRKPGRPAKTFKEAEGTPANAHAKELAKAKSNAKKVTKPSKTFYTVIGGKYLQITCTKKGTYSTFIGREKMFSQEQKKAMIRKWEKDGQWVPEHSLSEVTAKAIAELE